MFAKVFSNIWGVLESTEKASDLWGFFLFYFFMRSLVFSEKKICSGICACVPRQMDAGGEEQLSQGADAELS